MREDESSEPEWEIIEIDSIRRSLALFHFHYCFIISFFFLSLVTGAIVGIIIGLLSAVIFNDKGK